MASRFSTTAGPRVPARPPTSRREQRTVLSDPGDEPVHPLVDRRLGAPAEEALGLADIGDEDALVAGAPVGVRGFQVAAELAGELRHKLAEAQRVRRPAADVEDLAGDRVDPL